MLPKRLLIKRHDIIIAQLTECCPADEMFWVSCEIRYSPEFEEVTSIYRQIAALTDGNDKQFDKLTQQLTNMGIILEDPSSGNQWIYFLLSFYG